MGRVGSWKRADLGPAARPGAIGGGVTPSGRRPAHPLRRSRPRCAAGSASALTRSRSRCRSPRSSPRRPGCALPRCSATSSAPIRRTGSGTRWGAPIATSSAASAGGSTGPPTWSPSRATPRTSGGCWRCAPTGGWRRCPSAAARASSAASSPGSDTATAGPSRSTSVRSSGIVEIDEVSSSALIRAGTLGPDLEDGLRPHGLTLRHFPAVVRVLHPRRLDRDPGGRPFRHPADPHRRPGRLDQRR